MDIGLNKVYNGLKDLQGNYYTDHMNQNQNFFHHGLQNALNLVRHFANNFTDLNLDRPEAKENDVKIPVIPSIGNTVESVASESAFDFYQADAKNASPASFELFNHNKNNDRRYSQHHTISLSEDSEVSDAHRGFYRLQQYLSSIDSKMPELIPSISVTNYKDKNGRDSGLMGKVTFHYVNNPLPDWMKEVKLRMSGKNRGKVDIAYVHKSHTRRLNNKSEVMSYLEQEKMPASLGDKFDFRTVFCVCQTSEDPCRNFLECSFGLCGCSSWIHPECVGLGARSEEDLQKMKKVICPFCSYYLEGAGQMEKYSKNALVLKEITVGTLVTDVVLNDFDIEESNLPHRVWGLEGSHCSYEQKGKIFRPVFPNREAVLDILLDPYRRSSVGNTNLVISYNNPRDTDAPRIPGKRGRKRLSDSVHGIQHALLKGFVRSSSSAATHSDESDEEPEEIQMPLRDKRRHIMYEGKNIELGIKGGFVGIEKEFPEFMSEEEQMRMRIVRKIKANRGLEYTPSNNMEKDLLQLMLNSSRNIQKLTKKSVGRPSSVMEYSQKDVNSLMAIIPVDDGGVRTTTIACNLQPKSLHQFCSEKCCGFCMNRFTEDEMNHSVDVNVNSVEYPIHAYCHVMFQQNQFIASEDKTENSHIKIKGLHQYSEIDDAGCDVCGRTGGILVNYNLAEGISGWKSSSELWKAHIPCLNYILSSNLFCPVINSPDNLEIERAKVRMGKYFHEQNLENAEEKDEVVMDESNTPGPKSLFDVMLKANRCSLCGGDGGIVPRCIAANCRARAHPICSNLEGQWSVMEFCLDKHDLMTKVRGVLCPTHNP